MGLNFDFSECDINHEALWVEYDDNCGGKYQDTAPIPKSVVFMAMAIGIPSITEKNVKEFWRRTNVYQRVYGTMMKQVNPEGGWMDLPLTEDDIIHYIGLRTNAATISKQKFQMSLGA